MFRLVCASRCRPLRDWRVSLSARSCWVRFSRLVVWVKVAVRVDSRVVRRRVECPGFWAMKVEVRVGEGGGEFIFCMIL